MHLTSITGNGPKKIPPGYMYVNVIQILKVYLYINI